MGVGVRTAVLLGMAAIALALPSLAAAERNYSVRSTTNAQGDITGTGKTLMTCRDDDAKCGAARNGQASGGDNNNNNSRSMTYVDVDGDANTFNSSAATLGLPAGARVLFAGLYYGGDLNQGQGARPRPMPARATRSSSARRTSAPTSR
jgi:hypothetical protein